MTINLEVPTAQSTTSRSLRATSALALVSGAALVTDTVTIAVINRSFDPLDSILFFTGFAGMLLTAAALATYLSQDRAGLTRLACAVGLYLAIAATLGALSFVFDQMGRHVFSPTNRGLHGEWSFFSIGVTLLLIGAWAAWRRGQAG